MTSRAGRTVARIAFHRVVALAGLWASATLALAAAPLQSIDWQDLRPAVAAEDNPFAALSDEQLDSLRQIVLARVMQQRGLPVPDSAREKSAELILQLRAQGIDANALLARRDAMIAERQVAAEAGVAGLDGANVRLIGFLLPAAAVGGQVSEFLLVPWVGACSHTPPPAPNQIVRVKPARPYELTRWFEPVAISGTLSVRPEHTDVYLVDGRLSVRSAYSIDGAAVASTQQ